jgi:hypothetical protein
MTSQQFREAIPSDHAYRWLVHDRSGIFSQDLDRSIEALGIEVLKTPPRAPKGYSYAEQLRVLRRSENKLRTSPGKTGSNKFDPKVSPDRPRRPAQRLQCDRRVAGIK